MAVFSYAINSDGSTTIMNAGGSAQQIFRTVVNRNHASKTPISAVQVSSATGAPLLITYSDGTTRNVSSDLDFTLWSYGTYGPFYSENGVILTVSMAGSD